MDAAMTQNKVKTTKFEDNPGAQRTGLQESDVTLAEEEAFKHTSTKASTKGYTNIRQHDTIDDCHLEQDKTGNAKHDDRDVSFKPQSLTGSQP